MSITTNEKYNLFGDLGVGKVPYNASSPVIAQTISLELANTTGGSLGSGQINLTAIYLPLATTITNITLLSNSTAESGGSHLWFALYDDGRSSSSAGQLALLSQTADQTGATVFAANSALTLALLAPYVTTYSGIYYIAFCCTASTVPSLANGQASSLVAITASGVTIATSVTSTFTNLAPNPSGALTATMIPFYSYVS